jgi:hypothetical protein
MKNITRKFSWNYGLLLIPLLSAILALVFSKFIFKAGVAGTGIVIIIALYYNNIRNYKEVLVVAGAFLFSIAGDWFLSNRHGDINMFIAGIALFFVAHAGYLTFALVNGRLNRMFTLLILGVYLVFFFLVLHPGIQDKVLMTAALVYLLISCFSVGAATGITEKSWFKWLYIFGIAMVLFSDTIISLREFVKFKELDFLILPTYYLAQVSIVASLIYRKNNKTVSATSE